MKDHVALVTTGRNNHGYPYYGVCSCGSTSAGYAAPHAAQLMVDAHLDWAKDSGARA